WGGGKPRAHALAASSSWPSLAREAKASGCRARRRLTSPPSPFGRRSSLIPTGAKRSLPMAPWDPSYRSSPTLLDIVRASAWDPPNLPVFRSGSSPFANTGEDRLQPIALTAPRASNPPQAELTPFPGYDAADLDPAHTARLLEDAKRAH